MNEINCELAITYDLPKHKALDRFLYLISSISVSLSRFESTSFSVLSENKINLSVSHYSINFTLTETKHIKSIDLSISANTLFQYLFGDNVFVEIDDADNIILDVHKKLTAQYESAICQLNAKPLFVIVNEHGTLCLEENSTLPSNIKEITLLNRPLTGEENNIVSSYFKDSNGIDLLGGIDLIAFNTMGGFTTTVYLYSKLDISRLSKVFMTKPINANQNNKHIQCFKIIDFSSKDELYNLLENAIYEVKHGTV